MQHSQSHGNEENKGSQNNRKKKSKKRVFFIFTLNPNLLRVSPIPISGRCSRHNPAASLRADTATSVCFFAFRQVLRPNLAGVEPWSSSSSVVRSLSFLSWIFHFNRGVSGLLRFPPGAPYLLNRVPGVFGLRRWNGFGGWRSESGEGFRDFEVMPTGGWCDLPENFIFSGESHPFRYKVSHRKSSCFRKWMTQREKQSEEKEKDREIESVWWCDGAREAKRSVRVWVCVNVREPEESTGERVCLRDFAEKNDEHNDTKTEEIHK